MSTASVPMFTRYRPLLLILALLILPFIIGGGLYAWGWRPAKASSHGELLTPAKSGSSPPARSTSPSTSRCPASSGAG